MKRFLASILVFSLMLISNVEASSKKVYLGGETVAIQGSYQGVIISGMYDFKLDEKWISTASQTDLKVGDKIIAIEDKTVNSLDDLYEYLSIHPKENAAYPITVIRNQNKVQTYLRVYYQKEDKLFKTGLYVKDKIKGIGTVTYYDPSNHAYGALGHEIMDNDLGKAAEISMGNLFLASVNSINPSTENNPGEKNCLNTKEKIGTVVKNTSLGLYGYYNFNETNKELYEVASQAECELGDAYIYTVLHGTKPEKIKIRITKLNYQSSSAPKGIQFEIVDEDTISYTGGIVQGTSGSPIIQNGKIIGAVTHMITSSPTKGYGVFIEWMLEQSDQL